MHPSEHQISRDLLREALRDALLAAVESGRGGGIGAVPCRASAALYALLGHHPIDRRGRCRSCRTRGTVVGRRRRVCQVLVAARFYLHQPELVLLWHLADKSDERNQAPAVSPPPTPAVPLGRDGRTETTAGPGSPSPERPRPRRAPSDGQAPPRSDRPPPRSPLVTRCCLPGNTAGGVTEVTHVLEVPGVERPPIASP